MWEYTISSPWNILFVVLTGYGVSRYLYRTFVTEKIDQRNDCKMNLVYPADCEAVWDVFNKRLTEFNK